MRLPIVKEVDTPDPSCEKLSFSIQIATHNCLGDFVSPLTISAIELCAAVIAACIPTYRPFFNLIVNGDPTRDTKASSNHGISGKSNDSSFPTHQIPLSDVSNVKADIQRSLSPRPQSIGYTNLDDISHEKNNQNQIFVTKSFTCNASPV